MESESYYFLVTALIGGLLMTTFAYQLSPAIFGLLPCWSHGWKYYLSLAALTYITFFLPTHWHRIEHAESDWTSLLAPTLGFILFVLGASLVHWRVTKKRHQNEEKET